MADDEKENIVGVRCPRCNCADLRVRRTMPATGGKIKRYRACRHCGTRVITVEMMQIHVIRKT